MKFLSDILVKAGVIIEDQLGIGTNSPLAGYNIDSRGSHAFGDFTTERYHYFQSSGVAGGSAVSVYANNTSANNSRSHIMLADTVASVPTRFGLGVFTGAEPYAYLDSASKLVINNASGANVIIGGTVDNGSKLSVYGTVSATSLAGTDTRMVVANATGVLSTQAVPTFTDTNIYNSDGTLTGNRTVTMGGNTLTFSGGDVIVSNDLYFGSGGRIRSNTLNSTTRLLLGTPNIAGSTAALLFALDSFQLNMGLVYYRDDGNMSIVAGSGTNTTSYTRRMTFFSSGNIGINTTTDAGYRFDVNGTTVLRNTTTLFGGATLVLNDTTNTQTARLIHVTTPYRGTQFAFQWNGSNVFGYNAGGINFLNSATNNDYLFINRSVFSGGATGGNGFTFEDGGSFAPTTGANTYNLIRVRTVYNSTGGTNTITGFSYDPILTSMTGVTHRAIHTVTGDVLLATTSGNVVIGSATVHSLGSYTVLSVIGRATDQGGILKLATSNLSNDSLIFIDSGGLSFRTSTNDPINFQTNGNNLRMRIFNGGNVGINTATDAGFRLDVQGTARMFNTNTDAQIQFTPSSVTSSIVLNSQSVSGQIQTSVTGTYTGFGLLTPSNGVNTNVGTTSGSGGGINFWGSLNGSAHSFRFFHNTAEIARLSYTGSLLLGTPTEVASSILTLESTTKGVLLPRMTTTQRDAIATPTTGLQIYNTTTNSFNYYNGTIWVESGAAGSLNIYNTDGTLTGNRTVTMGGNSLTFTGGVVRTGFLEVNTPSATSTLTVGTTGHTNATIQINKAANTNAANLFFASAGTNIGSIVLNSSNQLSIGNTNGLLLNPSGGNVLINTTTDAGFRLDVNGTGRFSSDIIVNDFNIGRGSGNQVLNISFGLSALNANTTGIYNTGIGYQSLVNVTTGNNNTGIGAFTVRAITTQSDNVGIGTNTMQYTAGSGNTAIGSNATRNPSGSNFVAIGAFSGQYIADGATPNNNADQSIFIGAYAKSSALNQGNQIVIGYNAVGLGSNTMVLGNSSIVTTHIAGNVGIGTTSPAYNLHVQAAAGATTAVKATNQTTRAFTEYESYTSGNVMMRGFVGTFHDNSAFHVRTETAHPITFSTTNTERMRIFNTGNIGINTTTDAGFRLDVNGTSVFRDNMVINAQSGIRILGATGVTNSGGYILSGVSGGGDILIQCNYNGAGVIENGGNYTSRFRQTSRGFGFQTSIVAGSTTQPAVFDFSPFRNETSGGNRASFTQRNYFEASSGNAGFVAYWINPVYNFTGTYSADVVGIKYDPILTSMVGVNHIAIQTVVGNVLFATTSGNVGIGTTSPAYKFDVATDVNTSAAIRTTFTGGAATAELSVIAKNSSSADVWGVLQAVGSDETFRLRTVTNHPIAFHTNNTERGRITAGGNWLINTTTDAGYRLNVNGSIATNNYVLFTNNANSGISAATNDIGIEMYGARNPESAFRIGYLNAMNIQNSTKNLWTFGGPFLVYTYPAGTNVARIINISHTINTTGGTNTITGLYYDPVLTSTTGTTHRAIHTVTGDVLLATTSGNVGVGTTAPGTKLDVNGRFRYQYSDNASTDGQYGSIQRSVYTLAANTANRNLYNTSSTMTFNLTNGALSGTQLYNVAADFSQIYIYGNNGTASNQPFRAYMVSLLGGVGQPAMNITDFRYFDVKTPDAGGVAGHQVATIYGLRIGQMRGANGFNITTGYGIYQDGSIDLNYFAGNVMLNTITDAGFRLDVNGTAIVRSSFTANSIIKIGGTSSQILAADGSVITAGTGISISGGTISATGGGGGGISSLNGLTDATQTFAVGSAGTDFNISSASATHTFNIPDASLTARGLVTTGIQSFNGDKTIKGSGNTSATSALTVQNSSATNLLQVRNDNVLIVYGELRSFGVLQTNSLTTRTTGNVAFASDVQLNDTRNLIVGTTTGSKIGTATNQRLGFWNATPIVQPTTAVASATVVLNSGSTLNDASTFDGYNIAQVVRALRNMGLLA